jgi:hypothetical protein
MHVNVRAAHANVGVPPEQGKLLATAQMSMNKGLKLFGEAGIEAVCAAKWHSFTIAKS